MTPCRLKTRREFLKCLIKGGLTFLFLLFGVTFLRFLYPSKIKRRELKFYPVMKEEELPRQGVKRVDFPYTENRRTMTFRAFLVNRGGEIFALSSVCSHLGCLVDWSRHKNEFFCPCHGGKYDIEGKVIAGPPPAPLARMPLKVEGGEVYIGLKI